MSKGTDVLKRVYDHLPAPLRSLAATARGYQLLRWRFGPESEQLIEAALERERLTPDQLRAWQEERIAELLHRAATRVPYYRDYWTDRRRHGDQRSFERLEHWPVLTKDTLREQPLAFVADDCEPKRMFPVQTSGTTGKPMRLWRTRAANRAYYALMEARIRRWNGVSWTDRAWAILGGQGVVPAGRTAPPYWVWNGAMHQLYLSANHVSPESAAAFHGALEHYRPTHLIAYASSASALAHELTQSGLEYRGFKAVIANSEPIRPSQRAAMTKAFGAPVRETYGMVETVAGASECAEGRMHLWPDMGMVEVFDDSEDQLVAETAPGRLICTGLVNPDMPLIRYLVGDRGSLASAGEACACRRSLPILKSIEGRSNDLLLAPDGRRVYWLNPVFYGVPVREAQIIQEELRRVIVRYVPDATFDDASGATIAARLRERLGDVDVRLERVAEIPRGPNGKFKAVVCQVAR